MARRRLSFADFLFSESVAAEARQGDLVISVGYFVHPKAGFW